MSSIRFLVYDIDIKPIAGASVKVAGVEPGAALVTDANGATPTVRMTDSSFGYNATHPDFARNSGGGSFTMSQQGPAGTANSGNILSMKWFKAAGDDVVEVAVILGKIAPPLTNDCYNKAWLALDCPLNPLHGTGTTGWDRFNASHIPLPQPRGEFLACEVIGLGLPRLVATWQPQGLDLRSNKPVNYLVYFHPFRPPKGPYPFDPDYLDVGRTYLGNPRRTVAHMTQQGIQAIGLVPIFPLTDAGPYESLTMTQVYRLVREVNFFLQMRAGAQVLTQWRVRQPVGKVAVCCFSYSIHAVASLLAHRGDDDAMASEFFDQKLCEVYAFDPVANAAAKFIPGLVGWFRKGAGGRRFRLYTEFDGWVGAYLNSEKQLAGTAVTPQIWTADGATGREWHGPGEAFTFAFFPLSYVQPVVDIVKVGGAPSLDAEPNLTVHGFFPGYFLGHALANSSLK